MADTLRVNWLDEGTAASLTMETFLEAARVLRENAVLTPRYIVASPEFLHAYPWRIWQIKEEEKTPENPDNIMEL